MTEPRHEPDPFTLAWWKKQFRGLQHYVNLMAANCDDAFQKAKQADQHAESVQETADKRHAELMAKVGELQEKLTETASRQAKMAEWIKANCGKCKESK